MEKILEKLQIIAKYLLFLTVLAPIIVTPDAVYPFITGKALFFRSIIEIALALFLIAILLGQYKDKWKLILKNPLFISFGIFFISLIISVIFSINPYRAFWGDMERAEGLVGLGHFFAFLVMVWAVFNKKDWSVFLKATIGVGAINILYGFFQYFGVKNFPFMSVLPQVDRPGSFIGNPAFFAAYVILIVIFSLIVFFESKFLRQKFWQYSSFSLILVSLVMVFITGTRGAILGLAVAALFLLAYFSIKGKSIYYKKLSIQKLSIGLLALGLIFTGIFWFTRSDSFWQNIPGLDRLARTEFVNKSDPSTQTRLMLWQTSLDAFRENPIFGWGQDNYIAASSKYYNPNQALYGESWFDRAHNKLLDILVMQGIFGLLAYLGIFVAIFYTLIKISGSFSSFYAVPLILSLVIAYFVQNLFVFEDFNVNILFFVFLGFLVSYKIDLKKSEAVKVEKSSIKNGAAIAVAAVIIAAAGYCIYYYNFIPYAQAKYALAATTISDKGEIMKNLISAFYPYNFSQVSWRSYTVDNFYDLKNDLFERQDLKDLADLLEKSIDEVIESGQVIEPRWHIRKNQILNIKAKKDPEYYVESEKVIRKAIELAPKRQELYYGLAFSLAGQERFNEAIEAVKFAADFSPNVARARYHLALMYAVGGKNIEAVTELENVMRLDPEFKYLLSDDKQGIVLIYTQLNRTDKIIDLILKNIDGKTTLYFDRKYYFATLNYFIASRDAENALRVAKYLNQFPELKSEMEVFIDLLQKKDWVILESLF